MNNEVIVCILERGKADEVVKAAVTAGAGGATILFGRGSGATTFSFFHSLNVDSAKEVVIILVGHETRNLVVESISQTACLNEPGKGLLFTFPVSEMRGISTR